MKTANMKKLVTCLSLLMTLVVFGCVQNTSSEKMDGGMGNMEETMEESGKAVMNESMGNTMDENMDNSMGEMENDAAKENKGGMEKMMK